MFPQTANTPYGLAQLNSYRAPAPYQFAKTGAAGGKTLLIIAGMIGAGILIGMSLGLGLGIGAAGLVGNGQLINVINVANATTG